MVRRLCPPPPPRRRAQRAPPSDSATSDQRRETLNESGGIGKVAPRNNSGWYRLIASTAAPTVADWASGSVVDHRRNNPTLPSHTHATARKCNATRLRGEHETRHRPGTAPEMARAWLDRLDDEAAGSQPADSP
jgi:hypothetical protein